MSPPIPTAPVPDKSTIATIVLHQIRTWRFGFLVPQFVAEIAADKFADWAFQIFRGEK